MTIGQLIVFEGIDGAGKSTQVKLLYDYLQQQNKKVVLAKEPSGSPFGDKIREKRQTGNWEAGEELSLYALDRAWHAGHVLRPAINNGCIVLLDRYYFSTAAYQASLACHAQSIIRDCLLDDALPWPDLVLYFDMAPELAMKRLHAAGRQLDVYENLAKINKARQMYNDIFRLYTASPVEIIFAGKDQQKCHEQVCAAIKQII